MQQQCTELSFELYDTIPTTGQSELRTGSETSQLFTSSTQTDCQNNENFECPETEESEAKCPTYAIVDKQKKMKPKKHLDGSQKSFQFRKVDSLSPIGQDESKITKDHEITTEQKKLEQMYAVVHKKPNKDQELDEKVPAIPLRTTESLYTAVQKKPNKK